MVKYVYFDSFRFIICTLVITLNFYKSSIAQVCPKSAGIEKITNGDFSAAVTGGGIATDGFSSQYTYSGSGSVGPGQWAVSTSASGLNSFYANPVALAGSPAGGRYMVIDVDGTLGKDAYSTSVNVIAGTTYFFSAWFANINTNVVNGYFEASPILRFSINGSQVGSTVRVDSTNHNWKQFFVVWTAPATAANVPILIENERSGSNGNDLALDNISFSTGCDKIPNINTLGKSSSLQDTLYSCNVTFPYIINPVLGAGYINTWKNSAGTNLAGTNPNNTYTFSTAPAVGKYYLCYDTITGCPRTDSVIVVNQMKVQIGANQIICPPINYTIDPGITASGVTYVWKRNGVVVGGNTSTYQATQTGSYTVTATSACGSGTSNTMTINTPTPAPTLTGTGTFCTSTNKYDFVATGGNMIGGTQSVKWFNVPVGGSAFTSAADGVSTSVTAASLASTPGCAAGGLYAEDQNSFLTRVGPATVPCAISNKINAGASVMMLNITSTVTLNTLDIQQLNYSAPGTSTYNVTILNNNTTGFSGADGPSTTLFTAASVSFPSTATSPGITRTLPVGYTLTPGKYWIQIAGSELGEITCGSSTQANTPSPSVASYTKHIKNNNLVTENGPAFNMQFNVGNFNSTCSRLWVCAVGNGCALPVKWVSVNVSATSSGNQVTWVTTEEINNQYFIVERSNDGINFTQVAKVNAHSSRNTGSYEAYDNHSASGIMYYRIMQVDNDGTSSYSHIVSLNVNAISQLIIYPVPADQGQEINIELPYHSEWTYKLFDITGKFSEEGSADGHTKISIGSNSLSSGIYIIEVYEKNNLYHGKIVVY